MTIRLVDRRTSGTIKYVDENQILEHLISSKSAYSCYDHETKAVKAYYDFDFKYDDQKEQEENTVADFKKARDAVESEYPEAKFAFSVANGWSEDNSRAVNSIHIVVNDGCAYQHTEIKLIDGCDPKVYQSAQLFRLPFTSKEILDPNTNRIVGYEDRELIPVDRELNSIPIGEINILDYLPEYIDGMKIIQPNNNELNAIEASLADDVAEFSKTKSFSGDVSVENIDKLCSMLDSKRFHDRYAWLLFMRCLKNMEIEHGFSLCTMAHQYSSNSGKYKFAEVDNFYKKNRYNGSRRIGYATLCYWARQDSLNRYIEFQSAKTKNRKNQIKTWVARAKISSKKYEFDNYLEFDEDVIEDEYEIFKYLNDSLAHVVDRGHHKLYTINYDDKGNLDLNLLKTTNPYTAIDDVTFTVGGITKYMSKCFKEYYKISYYKRVDFIPFLQVNPCPGNVFNIFNGFKCKSLDTYDENKIEKILYHIREVLCNGDKVIYDYFIRWIAHIFQKPAEKPGVCILLQSDIQGVGKNMVITLIQKMLGDEHFYKTNSLAKITEKFNYHLQGKLLINGDEIMNFTGYKNSDMFKALITEEKLSIEAKGKDSYMVNDYGRYILTSNNENPIKIEKTDRRFMPIKVEILKDDTYFRELRAVTTDDKCVETFFNYLINIDLSNFNVRKIPDTGYRNELRVESNTNTVIMWLKQYPLLSGDNLKLCKTTYNLYKTWCEENGFRGTMCYNNHRFGKEMVKLNIDKIRKRPAGGKNPLYHYSINTDKLNEYYKNTFNCDMELSIINKNAELGPETENNQNENNRNKNDGKNEELKPETENNSIDEMDAYNLDEIMGMMDNKSN